MKIIHFVAESLPFVKTGGLADAVYSLAKAEAKAKHDVSIVLPNYKKIIKKEMQECLKEHSSFLINLSWRKHEIKVSCVEIDFVKFYLIEDAFCFSRDSIYGDYDDGERFSLFMLAALTLVKNISESVDIIHCHDWHSSLVPMLLKEVYKEDKVFKNTKSILTIHNPAYQGVADPNLPTEFFNIDMKRLSKSLDTSNFSFLKVGIVYADKITTVSNTHKDELTHGFNSYNLESLLLERDDDFIGILNGIDYDIYNSESDKYLVKKYTGIEGKKANKLKLQALLNLPINGDFPLISFIARLTWQKGVLLIQTAIPSILEKHPNLQIVILGTGDKTYENDLLDLAKKYPNNVSVTISYNDELSHQIYASSDYTLMPSLYEPCGSNQLISYRYLTVPIVRETGGLIDTVIPYNEYEDKGTGFSFKEFDSKILLWTINYALSFYQTVAMESIIKQGHQLDFSWVKSADKYLLLYKEALNGR